MGEEIPDFELNSKSADRFLARLDEETALLSKLNAEGGLSESGYSVGFEIEAWLLDHSYYPHPINDRFLDTLSHPFVVPELSRFNVELNCNPMPMSGSVLRQATEELSSLWTQCNHVAHGLDTNLVMIGTLPILRDEDLSLVNISPLKRYAALNEVILAQRDGAPLVIEIEGEEHLRTEHRDVMMEAATTSFQIHLKTPASVAHRYYNASIMASAPLLSAAVNAPFLFGRSLWQETRIPVFEQAIALTDRAGNLGRVTFGGRYLDSSLVEALVDNLNDYSVLLPILFDEPADAFRHLRLHNGTVWRWNRPLIGFDADGTPHLRTEHRALPAGPTIIDMIANAACYFGLVRHMIDTGFDERAELSFNDAKRNFYEAARHGIDAQFVWPGVGRCSAQDLLLDTLIPAAHDGLRAFGVDEADRDVFLGLFATRVRSRQTGASWQIEALNRHGGNFREMMSSYCERQRSGAPVHQWRY